MNDQPNPSQLKNFGAPPPSPSGLRHITPWMKVLATGGIVATVGVYGLQVGLPDKWKPSSVAGDAAGDTVRHEILGMRDAKIDMERRIADGVAQANAKAQADVIAITKAAEERTASLAPLSAMAGLADAACISAQIVSSFTRPKGWGNDSSDEFYFAAQKTGAATCGVGNGLRDDVTRSQLDAVRQAAAARGTPMQNGAVPVVPMPLAPVAPPAAPIPVAMPTTLDGVYAISRPTRHYPQNDVAKARAYIRTLPQPVQDRLFADLDDSTGTAWDVLVDRTRAYVVVATLK